MNSTVPSSLLSSLLLHLRSSGAPARVSALGRVTLLAALLLSPTLLHAEAVMTLRTATLIDRYAESRQQVSPRAQVAAKSAAADEEKESAVGVLLSVADTFDVKHLEELGISVGVRVNGVVTARATPAQLAQAAHLSGVTFINADSRVRKKLNVAVPLVGADAVQQGKGNLPQAYTGKGVIIGVVDWGFDFTHETFYDMQGNLRIVRVWDQTGWGAMHGGDGVSVPYGAVYATPSEMLERQCSSSSESHGTHVAGIAAGSGGEMGLYKGVAPDAELVLVHLHNGSQSELIEGLDYIFRYANQAGKPAVANLSLGTHYGPHDGTSQFDRALDGLVGNGRIAVGAAGNEGGSKLHASHTFNKSGSVVRTVVGVTERKSSVIAFAPTNRQLQWTVEVWDVNKNTRLHQATGDNFCSTQSGSRLNNKRFIATATDTVTVSGMGYNNYDGSNRGVVEIDATNNQPSKYAVVLVLKMAGDELGTVHLWNLGNEDEGAPFGLLKNSTYTWIDGNDSYTVGEIGGISKNIISVGSYNSRRNGDEAVGAVSYFSSKGPTVDGRVKPDIIAPGYSLFSAVNSCTFPPALLFRNIYEEMSGTSMATPMVTGAVALLLQKSPTLTPDNVRCLLQQNASTDQIEHLSQNTRGAGKLDIQRAMENGNTSVCTPLSAQHSRWSDSQQAIEFKIIPNPNNGTFVLETEEEAKLTFSVYNMVGALLYSSTVQADGNVELNFLPHGLYVVQLSSEKKTGTKKMLVYR